MNHKIIFLISLFFFLQWVAYGQNLKTTSFDADIVDHILVNAELSSTVDSEQRTHIAWISHEENSDDSIDRALMYTVVDGADINTVEVYSYGTDADLMSPSIILDDQELPHIVFAIQRDINESVSLTGNSAVYYAGKYNSNDTFDISQVSANSTVPTDNSDDIFNSSASSAIRPQITIDPTGNILIGYMSDSSSLNGYDEHYIFARRTGGSWELSEEFNLFELPDFGPPDATMMSFPDRMSAEYHHGWGDGDPFFMTKTGDQWDVHKVPNFEDIGIANKTATFESSADGKVHYSWYSDSNNMDRFVHVVLNGSQIEEVKSVEINQNPGGHHQYTAVDVSTGRLSGWVTHSFSADASFIYEDESGAFQEIEFEDEEIGVSYGKKAMNYHNGFVSIVTASQSDQKIYVTSGYVGGQVTSSEREPTAPVNFSLAQNYPNPFNPSAVIEFGLPEASEVRLEVFNLLGQRIATLVNERRAAGRHQVQFDASNLSSGTYIYRIQAGEFHQTRKMMLIK